MVWARDLLWTEFRPPKMCMLKPQYDCIWWRAFTKILKIKWGCAVGPWPNRIAVWRKEETGCAPTGSTAHVKGHTRTCWEASHTQAKESPRQRRTLLVPRSWTSNLNGCDKINFCCLSCPVGGILSWQQDWKSSLHLSFSLLNLSLVVSILLLNLPFKSF